MRVRHIAVAGACLRLLETSSVGNVIDVIDSGRVLTTSTSHLQLQRQHDVVEPRVLQTHTLIHSLGYQHSPLCCIVIESLYLSSVELEFLIIKLSHFVYFTERLVFTALCQPLSVRLVDQLNINTGV